MDMNFFAESMAEICAHSLVFPGRPLRWVILCNPGAGGFVMPSRWKKNYQELKESGAAAQANPRREDCRPANVVAEFGAEPALIVCGVVFTEGTDSVERITKALINESKENTVPFYLIIIAGGDGTSLEALSTLYYEANSLYSNVAILRLPLGTGNDGADSPSLASALDLLIKPTRIEHIPALRLFTAPGGPSSKAAVRDADSHVEAKSPFLAFNILSVGLDAFVTHMTNKMKDKLPGDFYKLWVDIASLLYDKLYKVSFLDIKALDAQGREVLSCCEKILLLAVGASGHRTYGAQKKILPDDRNICALKQMSLLRKLALKDLFTTGKHIDKPEAMMFSACRVEFSGEYPILAQMDGEAILLQREDFPAFIELTNPIIPVLKPGPSGT